MCSRSQRYRNRDESVTLASWFCGWSVPLRDARSFIITKRPPAERDGVCIRTLRRAKFDLGIHSAKDGIKVVLVSTGCWGTAPPIKEARWPNKLLEMLDTFMKQRT